MKLPRAKTRSPARGRSLGRLPAGDGRAFAAVRRRCLSAAADPSRGLARRPRRFHQAVSRGSALSLLERSRTSPTRWRSGSAAWTTSARWRSTLFDLSHEPPIGVAIARLAALDDGETAEMVIVVLAPWRRRGIGRLLLQRLTLWAQRHRYRRLRSLMAQDNRVMRRLVEALGCYVASTPGEPGLLQIDLNIASKDDA